MENNLIQKKLIYGWILKLDSDTYNNILTLSNKSEIIILLKMLNNKNLLGNNLFGFKPENFSLKKTSLNDLLNLNDFMYSTKRIIIDKKINEINIEIINNLKLSIETFSLGNLYLDFDFYKDRIKFIKNWEFISKGYIFGNNWFNKNKMNLICEWYIYFLEKKIIEYYLKRKSIKFLKLKEFNSKSILLKSADDKSKSILINNVKSAYNKFVKLKPIKLLINYKKVNNFNEDYLFYKLIFKMNKNINIKKLLYISLNESISIIKKLNIKDLIDLYYIPKLDHIFGFHNIFLRFSIIKYYDFLFFNKEIKINDLSTVSNSNLNINNYQIQNSDFEENIFINKIFFKNSKNHFLDGFDILKYSKNCLNKVFNSQLNNIILENNYYNNNIDKFKKIIINRIKHLIESNYKDKIALVFGSSYYNIKVKDSDIDIMIIKKNNEIINNQIDFLKDILEKIKNINFITKSTPILNANIPIIKIVSSLKINYLDNLCFNLNESDKLINENLEFNVDISLAQYDSNNNIPVGIRSSIFIKEKTENNQILRELLLILKSFFSKYNLNDSYKGGINFYALTIFLLSFDKISKISEKNYLKNILNFFNYLITFQYEYYTLNLGYQLENEDILNVFKMKENFNENLVIFDPTIKGEKNISKNCFNFKKIVQKIYNWLSQYELILNEINYKLINELKINDIDGIEEFYNKTINKMDLVNKFFN